MKMESLQQRREELDRKEYQLKESLLKFDKFLKVCEWDVNIDIILHICISNLNHVILSQDCSRPVPECAAKLST